MKPRLLLTLAAFLSIATSAYGCGRPQDCGSNRSGCCSNSSEWEALTRRAFEAALHDRASSLRHQIQASANTFKTNLASSIFRSHRHLDSLFSTTYGAFYEKNVKVFADLFDDLRAAATDDSIKIDDIVTPFFRRLFRVVFMLSNPMTSIGLDEAECMGRAMDELAPFGDIPKSVVTHLVRTMTGWRQVIVALQTAHDALKKFTVAPLSPVCVSALTKMSICPQCSGDAPMKVCRPLCESTLGDCLDEWTQLDREWSTVIGWLRKLTLRLKDAYSLSATMDALPAMLSEAVMIYQDHSSSVTNRVATRCLMTDERMSRALRDMKSRQKRSIEDGEMPPSKRTLAPFMVISETGDGGSARRLSLRQIAVETETHQRATTRMVEQLHEKLDGMRSFFASLPKELCTGENVAAKSGEECWYNGGAAIKGDVVEMGEDARQVGPFRGAFVNEGVRFGLLSFRIATFVYGKNYTGYKLDEGSGDDSDDEDYAEGSGDDVSIMNLDGPPKNEKRVDLSVYPHSKQSSSRSRSWSLLILFTVLWFR